MWRLGAILCVLMVGCAQVPPPPPAAVPEASSEPVLAPEPVVETPRFKSDPLKYLAGRDLKPQPTRPLNVKSRCSHRDAVGTQTRLELLVKEALVKTFSAQVNIKGHGVCRFELKDFEQEAQLPQVLLRHKQARDCSARMWEQGSQVTIAFNSCPQACEGQAFDYLWPVVVDARNGRCH